jgi:methionyl-tRNA formyltransferase
LIEAGRAPDLVVTQPARPKGRGQQPQEPPVAEMAREHGLEVVQPESVRSEEFLARIRNLKPDLGIVVAFGQIFPKALLELPKQGCINVHASLLPKYRGAAPIQGAIADGQKKTGVTIMQMVEELDAGPILSQEDTPIDAWETAGELSQRLADLGAGLLVETVDQMAKAKGKLKTKAQKEEQATYAARLTKREAKVNWALNAQELFNRLRAQSPWPGLSTRFQGHSVKLVWGVPIVWEEVPLGTSGTYLGMRQGRLAVLCGQNSIFGIERLQRAGKKAVSAADYANGVRLSVGERFI